MPQTLNRLALQQGIVWPLTPEAFAFWSDRKLYELVDGRPVERFSGMAAAGVSGTILYLLMTAAKTTGEAQVFSGGLGYDCYRHRPNTVRKPNVTLVRSERLTAIRGDPEFMPLPADLAVEVVSIGRGGGPVMPRVQDHLAAGFGCVGVARLNDGSVTVHRPDRSVPTFTPGQPITAEPALNTFRCDVAAFFDRSPA